MLDLHPELDLLHFGACANPSRLYVKTMSRQKANIDVKQYWKGCNTFLSLKKEGNYMKSMQNNKYGAGRVVWITPGVVVGVFTNSLH